MTHEHLWERNADRPDLPRLEDDIEVDVAVVGGGITGATCALLLRRAGLDVALLEGDRVGSGTTGGTSAHLTTIQDRSYRNLVTRFGLEATRRTYDASAGAIDLVEQLARDHGIDCDFRRVPAYSVTASARELRGLDEEALLLRRLGAVGAQRVDESPLDAPMAGAIQVPLQGMFHPLRYVFGLVRAFVDAGGQAYEHTRVRDYSDGPPCRLVTARGQSVTARRAVVLATHTPIGRLLLTMHSRLAPMDSYVITARLTRPFDLALVYDTAQPYHYVRPFSADERDLVLVGGADHKTGHQREREDRFQRLEAFARATLPVDRIEDRWCAELFEPADGFPYVGRLPGRRSVFVITGLSGTGMTWGTAGAASVARLVQGQPDPWSEVVSPGRVKPLASAGKVVSENLDNAYRFLADRLGAAEGDPEALEPSEGRVMRVRGERVAAYRDPEGLLHLLSPVCRHAGCIVGWNAARESWDCPCHGGRYDAKGHVISGPPTQDLRQLAPTRRARPGRPGRGQPAERPAEPPARSVGAEGAAGSGEGDAS